ncbi:MAG: hypothetical protein BBJ57_08885 [Desulfobacterales bacterium PC51MH44]|nr:MAG: hypothetical protein BBJ57_08885 [Desulfobacterales bacterium PC51MH44]
MTSKPDPLMLFPSKKRKRPMHPSPTYSTYLSDNIAFYQSRILFKKDDLKYYRFNNVPLILNDKKNYFIP